MRRQFRGTLGRATASLAAVALLFGGALAGAVSADVLPDGRRETVTWADWWLPPDYSVHGSAMDTLFIWIFWITMIAFVVVEVVLVVFLIKYRHRRDRQKARFTHGNTKLEMAWTLAPAVILIGLALATKRVWDEYRYGTAADASAEKAQILVVGEQFKWNVVYPGPDHKLGRYMSYPKPTDPEYLGLSAEEASKRVRADINENKLGQRIDTSRENDPGVDDDYAPAAAGRYIYLPVDRPLEIVLSSRDVLHDFFLPNFRVKLDAVPGLRGLIHFRAQKQAQSTANAPLDQVPADKQVLLDQTVPGVTYDGKPANFKIYDADADPKKKPRPIWLDNLMSLQRAAENRLVRRAGGPAKLKPAQITPDMLHEELAKLRADLKDVGVERLTYIHQPFELVCEELCGNGHATMRGDVIFLSGEQYENFLQKSVNGPKTFATRRSKQTAAAQ